MGRALLLTLAVTSVVTVGGCIGRDNDAISGERAELGTISPGNVIPKSSPQTLVKSFRRYCVEGPADAAQASALLRADGFVPAGGWVRGMRAFVVDDRRPMVMISRDGHGCTVRATARTGQTHEVQTAIAQHLPGARRIPGQAFSSRAEMAWQTGRSPTEKIALMRNGALGPNSEIMLALSRR